MSYRSGTTFLHRLLARDERNFTSMNTWEILFAPSITLRKVVRALAALDRRLGGRLHGWLAAGERYFQEDNVMHRIALWEPEEDQYLFLHIWSALIIWILSAILEEAMPYTYFDSQVPRAERERVRITPAATMCSRWPDTGTATRWSGSKARLRIAPSS